MDDVRRMFDLNAAFYDPERRGLIPCFDDFYGMSVRLVVDAATDDSRRMRETPFRVLDLGTGTGLLAAMIRDAVPRAECTLVDFSEPMMEAARRRFGAAERIQYLTADYSEIDLSELGAFDAIVSSLSIHHLDHERKRRLFERAHAALVPGGVFINADHVCAESGEMNAYYRRTWLAVMRAAGVNEESIARSVGRRTLDLPAALPSQLLWLTEAGFVDVDCVYRWLDFGVFFGRRRDAA